MKKILALSTLLSLIFTTSLQAKIWRVNNNLNVVADFTDPQTAMTSASVVNGDTIHIEASANTYPDFTLTKKLTIIGAGYFLSETSPMIANPKTQANINGSYSNNIGFGPGSKGSSISGYSCNRIYLDDSLVTIQRCRIYANLLVNLNYNIYGDTIRQNYINGIQYQNNNSTKAENLIIYNNIFTANYCINFSGGPINNNYGYFINNICVGGNSYFWCINFTFQNNIFTGINLFGYQSSNVFFNSLSDNNALGTANGNQQNVIMDNVFVGWNSAAGYSSDGRFALKPGSPAIGAGSLNGGPVDCGVYGGPAPYVLSGMPGVPSIYTFTSPATVASGTTTMSISVSTISH